MVGPRGFLGPSELRRDLTIYTYEAEPTTVIKTMGQILRRW